MLKDIPFNVITGFLGAGKTTLILEFLRLKPATERWAVLVNEFGEIGIDGALLAGKGATIKEVPGGCLCCVNGLPMKVGLDTLLRQAKPHRLLIEPTGLGHPRELLNLLIAPPYDTVLRPQATLVLLDARKLEDTKVEQNAVFRDQLKVADVLIAAKGDLYNDSAHRAFTRFATQAASERELLVVEPAAPVELAWLNNSNRHNAKSSSTRHLRFQAPAIAHQNLLQSELEQGQQWLRRDSLASRHQSYGWLFRQDLCFDHDALLRLVTSFPVDRLKAAVHTSKGALGINAADGMLSIMPVQQLAESRIEVVSTLAIDIEQLQQALLKCLPQTPVQ